MNSINLLKGRKVCRAFKNSPVKGSVVEKLLEAAQHAPSGSNMQPWEVHIVMNNALEVLRKNILEAAKEKNRNYGAPFSSEVPEKYLNRRKNLMDDMKGYLSEDNLNLSYIFKGSLTFFNAPAVAFIYIHRSLYPTRVIDIGSYMAYFMIAAETLGLGTCPIGYIRGVSDVINGFIGSSDDLLLQIAIAFGYKDDDKAINKFKSDRVKIKDNSYIME